MQIKTKKQNADGLVRLETSGDLKEIIINEDFMNPGKESVSLCFKGKNSSGIVSLNIKEVQFIALEVNPKLEMMQNVKVLRFEKEHPSLTKKKKI